LGHRLELIAKERVASCERSRGSDGTGPLESPGTSKSATVPTPRHNQFLGTGQPDSTKLSGGPQSDRFLRRVNPQDSWPTVAPLGPPAEGPPSPRALRATTGDW
jgi:hypothetical protein